MTAAFAVLGIDPGLTGGWAMIFVQAERMKLMDAGTLPSELAQGGPVGKSRTIHCSVLRDNIRTAGRMIGGLVWNYQTYPVIERQEVRPRQAGHMATAFNYGLLVATVREALPSDRPPIYPSARIWKPDLGLSSDKEASRALASELFGAQATGLYWPTKSREGVAEAALLGYWRARRLKALMVNAGRKNPEGRGA